MRVLRHLRLCPRPVAKVGLTDSCGWEIRARRSLAPPFMVQMRGCKTVETFHEPSVRSRPPPRLADSVSRTRTTTTKRTLQFIVPMRGNKTVEAGHEPQKVAQASCLPHSAAAAPV